MSIMKRLGIAVVLFVALTAESCSGDDQKSAGARAEQQATAQLQDQAAVVVGMPAVSNFAEKRQLKAIYEMRDNAKLVTYTYIVDMVGKRHRVCPTTSVGFGIPYSTQFTAPERPYSAYQTGMIGLPQPEPNGLYMPSSADATWVLCLSPDAKSVLPTYVEPHVVVYLFEMSSVD